MVKRKARLDAELVRAGLAPSRERAQALVMAGHVLVDGERAAKPGMLVRPDAELRVTGEAIPYVSRGGLKLERALDAFGVDVAGAVCVDIGASTGGFTHCLLEREATRVYAIDVGYGQLDWRLRTDPRVVNLERVNVRYLDPARIPEPADLVVIDVSFISLELVLPVAVRLLAPGGRMITLVKPQFEAGKGEVGKGGIVRSRAKQRGAVEKVVRAAGALGLQLSGLAAAPEVKPRANVEYFALFQQAAPEGVSGFTLIESFFSS